MKRNLKSKFIEELAKVPIIQVACEKVGISRQTFYRWKKESKKFEQEVEKAMAEGVAFVNDMSEAQLLNMIKEQEFKAVSFWLKHRNDKYKEKVEVTNREEIVVLTSEQKKIIRQALSELENE